MARRPLCAEDKGLVYWALSSLMVAEERITTKSQGLVIATDSQEEDELPGDPAG